MKNCISKTALQVSCYTSVKLIPQEWDEFIPTGHFLERAQIRLTESCNLPDLSFAYVLVSKGGKTIAAAYFQVLHLKSGHVNSELIKPFQAYFWKFYSGIANPKLLVAGHLFRHDICSFHWNKEATSAFNAFECYQEAINKACRFTGANAVLAKDMDAELIPFFQNYAPKYLLLRNDISMEMDINPEWETISHYEKSLKHKYAQRYRKIRQQWKDIKVKELSEDEIRRHKSILFNLYKQVSENQQVRLGFLNEDFLLTLKCFYKTELRVWGIYEGDKMVAFFSAWVKDGAFDMFYIGFDYKEKDRLQLYFNILFFSIEQAISLKKQKLILGRTALDAKARMGCTPRYLSTFLYIRNGFTRRVVSIMQERAAVQEGEWENRHPFKDS